ncbi:MAG: hypothetical protein KCHDKBKB_01879 [Elusimicrobia bacterium]|nr:hypothetical protein [Elusimicrobiota bacterium]
MDIWKRVKDLVLLDLTIHHDPDGFSSFDSLGSRQRKIRFDNAIRIWISVPTYLACVVLWIQNSVSSLASISMVFGFFGIVQYAITRLNTKLSHPRKFDFIFSSVDLVAMSLAVYFTGGVNSPLYFIYFIPLVVHAFHRDMGVVIHSGFGGVLLYALVVGSSLTEHSPAMISNLGARLFFMLLTASIACLSLVILRKQDELEKKQIRQLKNLTLISDALNGLTDLKDKNDTTPKIITLINEGLGPDLKCWSRFLFLQQDGATLKSATITTDEQTDIQQEIPCQSCPVMRNNSIFLLNDKNQDFECPTEKFSFKSHVCLPLVGAENEPFGVLFTASPEEQAFQADELKFLQFVSKSMGMSIQRIHQMKELRKSLEMNSWVTAITIASSRSVEKTLETLLDGIAAILDAKKIELLLYQHGPHQPPAQLMRGGGIESELPKMFSLENMQGEILGVLKVEKTNRFEKFSSIELGAGDTFTRRAALAIENALAHEAKRSQIRALQEEFERKRAA